MKIHYYDFVARNEQHSTFNAAMIEVLKDVYPDANNLIFYGDNQTAQIINSNITGPIGVKKLKFVSHIKSTRLRDLCSALYVFVSFLYTRKMDVRFVSLAFPYAIKSLCFFSQLFHKKVFICLHGELHNFFVSEPDKYFIKMKKSFNKKNEFVTWVILGKSIFSTVKHLFNNTSNFIVINHPAIFFSKSDVAHRTNRPLVFGQLGIAAERKGSHGIFRLAEILEKEIKAGSIRLKIVGLCPLDFDSHDKGLVEYFDHQLSDDEYNEEIQALDFTLQLSTDAQSRAIASGTFVDSLRFNKPVLGIHNSYLDEYLKNDMLLGTNIEALAKIIKRIVAECDSKFYENVCMEFSEIREKFSVSNNVELFRKQLEQIK